ncbi:MAG TPA: hypothetical protein VJN20_08650, partial [Burkholderiales bacterium]|nr:hypothetical protein [Burkholderiales bacterium]
MFKRIAVMAVAMVSCAHAQIPSIPAKGVLPDMVAAQMPRGQAHPASVWKIAEKTRYRELLAKGTFDVLVVPFQVQFYGFGRSTRSLMTAQLALAVAADGARRVPDPYLVARALGDGERRVHPEEVFRLADELRVKTIVWGYVGHSNFGKLFLSLQRQDRM